MRPGETQLWRLANIGADIFYRLSLGGTEFHIIGEDGNPVSDIRSEDELIMPPGKRYDVLVQAPADGSLTLSTLSYDQGGDFYPEVALADVAIEGEPAAAATIPTTLTTFDDLSAAPIADAPGVHLHREQRQPVLHQRQDVRPRRRQHDREARHDRGVDARNDTAEQHPFHIHVERLPGDVGQRRGHVAHGWQDTVVLDADGGEVVIRMSFRDFLGQVRVPLPHPRPRGRRHDGRARGHPVVSAEGDAESLVALALRLGLHDGEAADLAGRAHVRAAVGLLVEPDDVDDTDLGAPTPG